MNKFKNGNTKWLLGTGITIAALVGTWFISGMRASSQIDAKLLAQSEKTVSIGQYRFDQALWLDDMKEVRAALKRIEHKVDKIKDQR